MGIILGELILGNWGEKTMFVVVFGQNMRNQ
jgi:hypothetical protein